MAFAGVTAIETRLGAVTVSVAVPVTPEEAAPIVVDPCAFEVASPPLATVATFELELDQVAVLVRSWVLESLKTPIALNCCCSPAATDGVAGVT